MESDIDAGKFPMIRDQFFDFRNSTPIEVPEEYRNSYLRIYIWLTSHNYEVSRGFQEKVKEEMKVKEASWSQI